MKKQLFIVLFIFSGIFVFGQSPIYPWNTPENNIEENAYLKDTQNQLLPYTGTWVYTNGNKKVTIKFQRIMYYFTFGKKYFMDQIAGRYKVENGSTVVYNDLNFNFQSADIAGVKIYQNRLYGSYFDELNCRILSDVEIWLDPANPNKMYMETYIQGTATFLHDDESCPHEFEPGFGEVLTIPNQMILYKQ